MAKSVDRPEVFYPLNVLLCEECLLVQFPGYVTGEIFSEYVFFSSYSDSRSCTSSGTPTR